MVMRNKHKIINKKSKIFIFPQKSKKLKQHYIKL